MTRCGRVRRGHAEDPRLEQLGLAGARRAADEGVRAVGCGCRPRRCPGSTGRRWRAGCRACAGSTAGAYGPVSDRARLAHFSMTASSELARSVPARVSSETARGRSLASSTGTPASTTGASWRAHGHRLVVADAVDGDGLHLLAGVDVAGERALVVGRRRGRCGTRPGAAAGSRRPRRRRRRAGGRARRSRRGGCGRWGRRSRRARGRSGARRRLLLLLGACPWPR